MKESAELFYSLYTGDFVSLIQSEEFFDYFTKAVNSGKRDLALSVRYSENKVDVRWIEEIEKAIIPLDNIIRNPRRFIEQIEEVVPISQARQIRQESIQHLAQHTQLIAKVEGDGEVTPDKILNIFKEESFATYENRFIYTLLINLQYFIDKRLAILNKARTNSISKVSMKNSFTIGSEELEYQMIFTSVANGERDEGAGIDLNADTSKMDAVSRVERIRRILYDFEHSPLIKSLNGCALVRPPIMKTNVLTKNPDFKVAMALWNFIEMYRDAGLSVELVENEEIPNDEYLMQLYSTMALNYCMLKHHTRTRAGLEEMAPVRKEIRPSLWRRTIEEYVNDLSMDIDVVQRIFVDEIKKSSKKRAEEEAKLKGIIDRALENEHKRKERLAQIEKEEIEKEKQRKLREQEQIKKAAEKKKLAEQRAKAKELERVKRLKEREKRKIEKEKQLERERIAAEKEKARLEQEKAKAEAKAAADKAKAEAKAAADKAKAEAKAAADKAKAEAKAAAEKEKARIKAEAERAKAKEKELAEKEKAKAKAEAEKEKARLKAESEKAKAKEKELADKAKAKAKADAEKERAKAKAAAEKEKLKAKEKAEKEKLKAKEQAEKEKLKAKELAEKEKAKAKAAAELQKAKEKAAAEKEKAKAKAAAEKEKAKLKAEIEKAKAKEKAAREKLKSNKN